MTHFFDESFVIAVCFIIFIYLSYRPIKKSILAALDAKIIEIKDKLIKAENLSNEAKNLFSEVKRDFDNFETNKQDMLRSAQESIKQMTDIKNKEMRQLLNHRKASAIAAIDNEVEKASTELKSEFTQNVLELVRAYLAETKNNNVSDQEIIQHFLEKS